MTFEARRVIAKDHPALAGHFPGNPIVPGALILDEVVQAAREWRGALRVRKVVGVKFSSPLAPGNEFVVTLSQEDRSTISFECSVEGVALASGRLAVDPEKGAP